MYRSIIVGYDGRDPSKDALALAKLIADTTGAKLTLAGVCPIPVAMSPGFAMSLPSGLEELKAVVEAAAGPVGADFEVRESTSPARSLYHLAEEREADLVVVGSHRHGRAGRALLGTTGMALLHSGPCAVAVAPAGYRDTEKSLRVLAVGIDGSTEAKEALKAAVELADRASATIRLLAAVDLPDKTVGGWADSSLIEALHDQVRQYLDEATALVPDRLRPSTSLVRGDTVPALIAEAEKGVDLMFLGSRGYGPIRRVLLGSTAARLIEASPCPFLVVPRRVAVRASAEEASAEATR
jgi:nucleotide-binding universal stress UspA family protein